MPWDCSIRSSQSLEAAIKDWVRRASLLGFGAKRANHVYVHRVRWHGDNGLESASRAKGRRPAISAIQISSTSSSDFRSRSTAGWPPTRCDVQSTGKLRVAYDIRHLPREQVGTRTYAVSLGQCLGEIRRYRADAPGARTGSGRWTERKGRHAGPMA